MAPVRLPIPAADRRRGLAWIERIRKERGR